MIVMKEIQLDILSYIQRVTAEKQLDTDDYIEKCLQQCAKVTDERVAIDLLIKNKLENIDEANSR